MAERTFTAFSRQRLIAQGDLKTMLLRTKEYVEKNGAESLLIFDDESGSQVDFDFRGTPDDVLARIPSHPLFAAEDESKRGPGRPKLGVISREVTLLPRHWDWLGRQPGGASAALRRLVDEKRKAGDGQEESRRARDAAGKFMWAIAGDLPNFEEATRALYSGKREQSAGADSRLAGGHPPARGATDNKNLDYLQYIAIYK